VLTNKGKYGLKAMIHLAGQAEGRHILISDIARTNHIPKKFLEAILAELRNAGLVLSKKGKGGGYSLARSAHEIMVGDIIRILDGPLAPLRCASHLYYRACDDCDEKHCAVRLMMYQVRNAIAYSLDKKSLSELRAMGDPLADDLMYHI
jgi:Rrf2 family protein